MAVYALGQVKQRMHTQCLEAQEALIQKVNLQINARPRGKTSTPCYL